MPVAEEDETTLGAKNHSKAVLLDVFLDVALLDSSVETPSFLVRLRRVVCNEMMMLHL